MLATGLIHPAGGETRRKAPRFVGFIKGATCATPV